MSPTPCESTIDAALRAGVLHATEAQTLHAAEAARRTGIDVDAFSKEALLPSPGKIR
ncbi:hypothetical protein D3C77_749180 [compost metagenome]